LDWKLKIGHWKWIGLSLWLTTLATFAFDAKMSVHPPLISMGESAQIKIEVRGAKKATPPILPTVPGLTFSGAGQSSHTSWVNGKSDHYTTYTFTVYPQQTGSFTLGPFAYTISGETKTLQSQLKVVATSGDATQPQSWNDLVFAQLKAGVPEAYVQEPFELTLSIFSRPGLQMAGNINLQGMPETGLSELAWKELPETREQIKGTLYNVRRYRTLVRAMGSGLFEFTPTVTIHIVQPNQQKRDPFFGNFFNRTQTRPVTLSPAKTTLSILPLPTAGKPSNFSGAVGQFNFLVTAQPLKIHPGDPVTLTMTIRGNGNFDRVMPPSLSKMETFRLYGDPVRQAMGDHQVRFEQVISPRDAEPQEIPPIAFSYFDTQAKQYRTVTSRPIAITVTSSTNDSAQLFAATDTLIAAPPDQPFATESDVQRFLAWLQRLWKTLRPWLWTLPVALATGLLLFFSRKLYHYSRHDSAWLRRQKAPKAAQKALRKATTARKQGDTPAFYEFLWSALADYFGPRLNLTPGDVTASIVIQSLETTSLPPETLNGLKDIFDQVDAGRYSPTPSSTLETQQQQTSLTQILKQCEKTKMKPRVG